MTFGLNPLSMSLAPSSTITASVSLVIGSTPVSQCTFEFCRKGIGLGKTKSGSKRIAEYDDLDRSFFGRKIAAPARGKPRR